MRNKFFTVNEARKILKITQPTLNRWIQDGRIPYEQQRCQYRLKKYDVLFLIVRREFPTGRFDMSNEDISKAYRKFNKHDFADMYREHFVHILSAITMLSRNLKVSRFDRNLFIFICHISGIKLEIGTFHMRGEGDFTSTYIAKKDLDYLKDCCEKFFNNAEYETVL